MSRTVGEQVKTGFRLAGGILSFCASLFLLAYGLDAVWSNSHFVSSAWLGWVELSLAAVLIPLTMAGGPGFDFADAVNTVGAPSFAFFAKGGYHERLQRRGARPLDGGTKSSSSLGSRAPAPIRPKDRNDNCSTATAPVSRPSLASLDCDVCSGASPRASSSSIR
jgi:hypothetical protein